MKEKLYEYCQFDVTREIKKKVIHLYYKFRPTQRKIEPKLLYMDSIQQFKYQIIYSIEF